MSSNGAPTWEGTKKLKYLAKVFQCHKFEPEVEFIISNSSSNNKPNSENEDFIKALIRFCWIVTIPL